ncbi:MAG: methylenetetrahydrofolate reductase [Eubacteriaceae bacterium]|nr:methylenetetrahydrofolate reductase [Eubacteriaceae bacterium]
MKGTGKNQKSIGEMLKEKMTFSFEVFPPKEGEPIEPLLETLDNIYKYDPDFISCTYGAGGTNVGRSEEVCKAILESGHNVMTHFTCIGQDRKDITERINRYRAIGVRNVLALRGDLPEGWEDTGGYFAHGDRLVNFIKSHFPDLCMGGACYPEKHLEAINFEADIAHLRSKQDNGAEFLMTQLCYDIDAFERFIERIRKAGVELPVIVGVMPVLYKNGLIRMTLGNGCSIPKEVSELIGKYGDNKEDFKKAGKEFTISLIYKYMSKGISGLHLYSLNKYKDLAEIINDSGIRGIF